MFSVWQCLNLSLKNGLCLGAKFQSSIFFRDMLSELSGPTDAIGMIFFPKISFDFFGNLFSSPKLGLLGTKHNGRVQRQ